MHEAERVYYDRLVDTVDREKYQKDIQEIVTKGLSAIQVPVGEGRPKSGVAPQMTTVEVNMQEVFPPKTANKINLFANFAISVGDGNYCQITEETKLKERLDEALYNHN